MNTTTDPPRNPWYTLALFPGETDEIFAYRPLRLGFPHNGKTAWLQKVKRFRCKDVVIYELPS